MDIKALLANALSLAGHFLRKADVRGGLTCRKPPPLIYGEASQLTQAFFNLLLNASQQIASGGSLEIVTDQSLDSPGFLMIEFWGTNAKGKGHDFSQSLALSFEADEESKTAGVGMCLVRDILKEAGAKITFDDSGERGVPLIIHLPVHAGGHE